MPLDIKESDQTGTAIITLSGDIVFGDESHRLRAALKHALERGKTQLILDLTGVRYIDSSGLGAIVASYTSACNEGATVKLAGPSQTVFQQLRVTGVHTIMEVYGSLDEALKSFEK